MSAPATRRDATGPRRRGALGAAAAAVLALAAPAAAQAATYTVAAGGGTCGGGDTSCESLVEAAGAVAGGDTVQIAPGVYNEAPTFTAPGVTITGSTSAPGVIVTGTITFSGSGTTPSVLEKLVVAPSVPASPAVGVSGSAGVAVRDAFLLSAAGSGMAISNGTGNELTRTTVVSGAATGAAVDVQAGTAPVNLVLSSSILSGGEGGSGLLVRTGVGTLLPGSAAPATVTARHVTIAGSANAIALDSSAAVGLLTAPAGSITATVTDSIVHGGTPRSANPGVPLVAAGNTATLTLTRTDQAIPDGQLFVSPARRNFHLRADAPVIDKGQVTPGDSATDVDGQPRENGAASDLGADEFVNGTPTASFAVTTPNPRSSHPITFDASGSTDREGAFGGGISEYRWTFGDGTTETTTTPTVNHTYGGQGAVAVQLVVVDRQGGTSQPATIGLRIADGTPPVVIVTSPRPNRTFPLVATTTKTVTANGVTRDVRTRKRARIGFGGRAKDPSGVTAVHISLQRLVRGTEARRGARASAAKKKRDCVWLHAKRGLIVRRCDRPILIKARLRGRKWAYIVPRDIKLGPGTYRVSAYGTDGAGSFGNAAPKARRVVRFKLTG